MPIYLPTTVESLTLSFDRRAVADVCRHAAEAEQSWRCVRENVALVEEKFGVVSDRARDLLGDGEAWEWLGAQPSEPGVFLAWDAGIYLMSAGLPHQEDPSRPGVSFAAYARGFDPAVDEAVEGAIGALFDSVDRVDKLPLSLFDCLGRAESRSGSGDVLLRVLGGEVGPASLD